MRISDWSSDVCSSDLSTRSAEQDAADRVDAGWLGDRRVSVERRVDAGHAVAVAAVAIRAALRVQLAALRGAGCPLEWRRGGWHRRAWRQGLQVDRHRLQVGETGRGSGREKGCQDG